MKNIKSLLKDNGFLLFRSLTMIYGIQLKALHIRREMAVTSLIRVTRRYIVTEISFAFFSDSALQKGKSFLMDNTCPRLKGYWKTETLPQAFRRNHQRQYPSFPENAEQLSICIFHPPNTERSSLYNTRWHHE